MVAQAVAEVGQIRHRWADALNHPQCLKKTEVVGMGRTPEGPDYQHLKIHQVVYTLLGKFTTVGDVPEFAYSVGEDFTIAVHDRNRSDGDIPNTYRFIRFDHSKIEVRPTINDDITAFDVGKALTNEVNNPLARIHWKRYIFTKGAKVIDSIKMIGVVVGVEDCRELSDSITQRLETKLRASIDD